MEKIISSYTSSKKKIMKNFGVNEDYPLKVMQGIKFNIAKIDGMLFLKYWNEDKEILNVIVNKNSEPLIIKKDKYTMVVAIDCIKIALLFENNKEV